jgi:hypothetical protein
MDQVGIASSWSMHELTSLFGYGQHVLIAMMMNAKRNPDSVSYAVRQNHSVIVDESKENGHSHVIEYRVVGETVVYRRFYDDTLDVLFYRVLNEIRERRGEREKI